MKIASPASGSRLKKTGGSMGRLHLTPFTTASMLSRQFRDSPLSSSAASSQLSARRKQYVCFGAMSTGLNLCIAGTPDEKRMLSTRIWLDTGLRSAKATKVRSPP